MVGYAMVNGGAMSGKGSKLIDALFKVSAK